MRPLEVVVLGGGVAGLEAAAGLRELAGRRVAVTIVADSEEFIYRPLTLLEAFGRGAAPRRPLREIAERLGARFRHDRGRVIDRREHRVMLDSGEWLDFDAIVLAPGASLRARVPAAITLGSRACTGALRELAGQLAAGEVSHLLFVAPDETAWPLPLYECALLCAEARRVAGPGASLTLVAAEPRPLARFGTAAGARIERLLRAHEIDLICGAQVDPATPGSVQIRGLAGRARRPETRPVDRIVALPELLGPHLRGLPAAPGGFIPIDRRCQVRGASGIYAAGDATDYPVRHGSLAAQQADVAATAIAAQAGGDVAVRPFAPILEGVLWPGAEVGPLRARLIGGEPAGEMCGCPPPAAKISARYLGRVLAGRRTAVAVSRR